MSRRSLALLVCAALLLVQLPVASMASAKAPSRTEGVRAASAAEPVILGDASKAVRPQKVAPQGYSWKLVFFDDFDDLSDWNSTRGPNQHLTLDNSNFISPPSGIHTWYSPDGHGNVGTGGGIACSVPIDLRGVIEAEVAYSCASDVDSNDHMYVAADYLDDHGASRSLTVDSFSGDFDWDFRMEDLDAAGSPRVELELAMDVSSSGNGSDAWIDDLAVWALVPADAVAGRLGGRDRYATAVEISKATFGPGTEWAVIATGANFPDALAGGCLASAHDAPLLLVGSNLPAVVRNELARLGVKKVYILGGGKAVPSSVQASLQAMGMGVKRIAGPDRYATAAQIARQLDADISGGLGNKCIIATGANFPDALAGSPLSGYMGWPILLVNKNSIPPATRSVMAQLGISETVVLGGTAAVSEGVKRAMPNPIRLAGANRYETMGKIGNYAGGFGMGLVYMSVATGENFPDALSGGVRTALYGGIMLLTPPRTLCVPARNLLAVHGRTLERIEAYGQGAVVSDGVLSTAVTIANSQQ